VCTTQVIVRAYANNAPRVENASHLYLMFVNGVVLDDKLPAFQKNKKFGSLPLNVPPRLMLVIMATAIYVSEALVMVVLGEFNFEEYWVETLLDSSSLLVILTPVYLFFYRPFWDAQKQHEKQIQFLSQQLIKSVEEERKRITRELHDHTGQTLTALQFGLQTLKRSLPREDKVCAQYSESLIEQTAQLSDDLRMFAARLRPETLDQLGLIAALEVEFKEFSKTYGQIELTHRLVRKEDLAGVINAAGELAIYRVCQEALTNIIKYAKAKHVKISLWVDDKEIVLQVKDDGVGFDVNQFWLNEQILGIGLLGMRERIGQLDGQFRVRSQPGAGTLLTAKLPVLKRVHDGTD